MEEIATILKLQRGRCIYCNAAFSSQKPVTKDHIEAVFGGGDNNSTNIVLACRSCNSRKQTIPLRSYCQILSAAQNRRILRYIYLRLEDMFRLGNEDNIIKFSLAINRHHRADPSLKAILDNSSKARRNAASNKLIPRVNQKTFRNILKCIELKKHLA